jgi:hypothetical protein
MIQLNIKINESYFVQLCSGVSYNCLLLADIVTASLALLIDFTLFIEILEAEFKS